jgi:uncharacterized protein (TIGR00255 family)
MIVSMTGYGRAHLEGESLALTVEIRSVNNRFLKVSVRLPDVWEQLTGNIETVMKERFARGTVIVNIHKSGTFAGAREYVINRESVEQYRRQLAQIDGGKDVTLSEILALPGAVGSADESEAELDVVWSSISGVIRQAADEMHEMRRREGEHLRGVLLGVVAIIRELTTEIRKRAPDMVSHYRDRLAARVKELLRDSAVNVSQTDLARELAIYAERSDIREEIDRMESHLKQFEVMMNSDAPVGRQLEFLVQEMFREMNTMGSKVADAELAKIVLDAKAEVDRLKEQVMNVE